MWYRKKFFENTCAILIVLLIIYLGYTLLPLLGSIIGFIAKILYPFILAFILYYVMRPLVLRLQAKMPLGVAIAIVFVIALIIFIFVAIFVYPVIIKQISLLESVDISKVINFANFNFDFSRYGVSSEAETKAKELVTNFLISINTFLVKSLIDFISSLTQFFLALVAAPFILYYLLKDGKQIHAHVMKNIPVTYSHFVRDILSDIDDTMLQFINGRVIISAITSFALFLSFLAIGIEYPFVLALISFIFYIVPTIGPFIATIPLVLVGFSTSTFMGILVLIIATLAMTAEGFIITPQVMKKTLYIHPLTIILILLIAGSLYGILGLLVATPAYAIIKIIAHHTYDFLSKKEENERKVLEDE